MLLKTKPSLNETDSYEVDDPVTKRIPQQDLNSHPILSIPSSLKFNIYTLMNISFPKTSLPNMTNTSPPKFDDFVQLILFLLTL